MYINTLVELSQVGHVSVMLGAVEFCPVVVIEHSCVGGVESSCDGMI